MGQALWKFPKRRGTPKTPSKFTLSCVADSHPRFYVELILWVLCVLRYLPRDKFRIIVYFVGDAPADLRAWLQAKKVEVRAISQVVEGSPHCNKIAPFLSSDDADCSIVCDTDVYFVDDASAYLTSMRFRAPPNNHCNPPPRVFKTILSTAGFSRGYRPGIALFKGGGGMRETHINNISGGVIAAPSERCEEFARSWLNWAKWLIKNRSLLESWAVHVDQVGFALAMEEMGEDVEFLPPQTNTILHLFGEIDTICAFHLTSAHIPQFPDRFNSDHTLRADGLAEGVQQAVERLNICVREAVGEISKLPSTKDHLEKFLNPMWKR